MTLESKTQLKSGIKILLIFKTMLQV